MDQFHHLIYDPQTEYYEKKYFGNDYNSNKTQHNHNDHDEYRKDILRQEIERLNNNLDALGIPRIGDQFSDHISEIQKTLATLQTFLSLRQKELDFRNQSYSKTKKIQNQIQSLRNSNEKLSEDKKRLQNDKDSLNKKIKYLQQTIKENNQKANQEKQDLTKQLTRVTSQENQFRNEIKKRDNLIKEKNDEILRIQKSGKGLTYRNSFDVLGTLEQNGPFLYYVNAEHEFGQMVQKNFQQTYEKLASQNKYYKECLATLYKELSDILELRKEMILKRKGQLEGDDGMEVIQGMSLNTFKLELLNMPLENSREAIDMIEQNVRQFRDHMDRIDIIGQKNSNLGGDGDKLKAVKNVRNLIKNYKQIVASQEQLINKVVVRAKEFKPAELPSKAMDDDELEKAKKFLEEQRSYVEARNKQIEITKKAMANSIRRVEEQRNEMKKKKKEIEQETTRLRKQIELIPTQFDSL